MSGLLGLILGLVALIAAFILEGGHLSSLLQPTAAMIVFGGTLGAIMVSYSGKDAKKFFKILAIAFSKSKTNKVELIHFFKELSVTTRKNGLLSIEGKLDSDTTIDNFTKKGLRMVVDGAEPDVVKATLELDLDYISARHKVGSGMFEAAGGYAPTMGIVGTVLGLVHILGSLDGDPAELAPKIAVAFIATLYGIGSANLLWLPVGSRLKELHKVEATEKELIIEAVTLIQSGANPNRLEQQLLGFLDKEEVREYEKTAGSQNEGDK